jgi:hypothetical protein
MASRIVLVGLCVALVAACAAGLQYTSEKTYPPRGTAEGIQVFDRREPPEAYERLGQITWDYQRTKFSPPNLQEIQSDLKQKVWEVGGDALIIRKLEEPRDPEGVLRVGADVVRWKR